MWRVLGVTGSGENLDTSETFGHTFRVRIVLEHRPSSAFAASNLQPFEEPPTLQWNEKISFLNHKKETFWDWSGDLYAFKRNRSVTFKPWRSRYYEAYNTAMMASTHPLMLRGSVELLDERDRGIRITHLPRQPIPQDDRQKAEVIRRFISRNICRLVVDIHDRPAIHVSPHQDKWAEVHKERLLLFDCGVGGTRVRASQYLKVKGSDPKTTWQRSFQMHWGSANLPSHNYLREFSPDLYSFESLPPRPGEYE
jgi:hypothetical protein